MPGKLKVSVQSHDWQRSAECVRPQIPLPADRQFKEHRGGKPGSMAIFVVMSFILCLLPSCSRNVYKPAPLNDADKWNYADLRLLEQVDAVEPQQDLIAVYARQSSHIMAFRIDFLETLTTQDNDLYLALDTYPGGRSTLPFSHEAQIKWDYLVHLPAAGEAVITVIQINQESLYSGLDNTSAQVFVTSPGSDELTDESAPFRISSAPPPPAKLLIAFWDVMPAATPAQALRRWNGAHTGPQGDRHGLEHLVLAAAENKIPVALLDLRTVKSMAAIDLMGAAEVVAALSQQGYLLLPDAAYGTAELNQYTLAQSKNASHQFGYSASPFAFAPSQTPLRGGYEAAFAYLPEIDHILQWQGLRLIPLPLPIYHSSSADVEGYYAGQVNRAGLTLEAKQALLDTALSADPNDFLVLGGSMPGSYWADSNIAPQAFQYLNNHPWIAPLTATDMLTMPARKTQDDPVLCDDLLCSPQPPGNVQHQSSDQTNQDLLTSPQLEKKIRDSLSNLPDNPISEIAYQAYLNMTAPTNDINEIRLRSNYIGEVGHIIEAAHWAADPKSIQTCQSDIDWDGQNECILATEKDFISFEQDGGRLLFFFSLTPAGAVQLVGPQSQLAIGLSDPGEWQLHLGTASDPAEIPGAFADSRSAWPLYRTEISSPANRIIFTSPDDQISKSFYLGDNKLTIEYKAATPVNTQIPIIFPGRQPTQPEWAKSYSIEPTQTGFLWGDPQALQLQFSNDGASYTITTFMDSLEWLPEPEDPNRYYSAGHFLPFPLAVININAPGDFTSQIELHNNH